MKLFDGAVEVEAKLFGLGGECSVDPIDEIAVRKALQPLSKAVDRGLILADFFGFLGFPSGPLLFRLAPCFHGLGIGGFLGDRRLLEAMHRLGHASDAIRIVREFDRRRKIAGRQSLHTHDGRDIGKGDRMAHEDRGRGRR